MVLSASMTLPQHAAARCTCSFRTTRLPRVTFRGRGLVVRAQEGGEQPPASDGRESMLEALEAEVKARKGAKAAQVETQRPARRQQAGAANQVVWKEGQLLPEGWEEMDLPTKVTQLYMGERGLMFWANKAAFASIFILIALWAAFRFLGPALGLYTLADDFQSF